MTEEEIEVQYAECLLAIRTTISAFDEGLNKHDFRSNLKHVVVLSLAQRMLEFARGCETVGRTGLAAANAALGRMCLETFFKLKAVCLGAVLPEELVRQEQVVRYQGIKRVLGLQNLSELFSEREQAEFQAEMQRIEQELGPKVGKHEIKLSDWATRADEVGTYTLVYSTWSDYVHTGVSSLSHIMEVREQGQVFIQTGPSVHQLESVVEGVCCHLALAMDVIDQMFANEHS